MKKMKSTLFFLTLAALSACSSDPDSMSKDEDTLMHTDFESLSGWISPSPSLTKERAHSGSYSMKVDKDLDFSATYSITMGQISSTRIRGMRMDAWVYLPNKDAKARWGVVVKDVPGGKDLLSDGFDLHGKVKEYGGWTKVSHEFSLPNTTSYNSQLVMFLWGPGLNEPVFIDDIQLTALR